MDDLSFLESLLKCHICGAEDAELMCHGHFDDLPEIDGQRQSFWVSHCKHHTDEELNAAIDKIYKERIMLIASATEDFDPDDLVERIMSLPLKSVVEVSAQLKAREPDWSFMREYADEISQLDTEQRQILVSKLQEALK